jgi:hypothetical protein
MKRTRYEVLPMTADDVRATDGARYSDWKVTRDGERISTHRTKAKAVELASTTARCAWKTQQQLGTLKIKGRNGRIQDERTYGRDPADTKG